MQEVQRLSHRWSSSGTADQQVAKSHPLPYDPRRAG